MAPIVFPTDLSAEQKSALEIAQAIGELKVADILGNAGAACTGAQFSGAAQQLSTALPKDFEASHNEVIGVAELFPTTTTSTVAMDNALIHHQR